MNPPKIDKQLLQKRFSQNAKTYDRYARIQKVMAQTLLEMTDRSFRSFGNPDAIRIAGLRILEVGCGTGYLTMRLQQRFPGAHITAVDLAPGMIEVAKRRISKGPVVFQTGDIEEMELEGTYDLIVSNATFQWFNHLPLTVKRLVDLLNPEGSLLFSTFGQRTFQELHRSFQAARQQLGLTDVQQPGQSFYSLPELRDLLCGVLASGRCQIECFERLETEKFQSVRDFFTSVKKIGASNSNSGSRSQRPGLLKATMAIYERLYRDGPSVVATYHTMFARIQKQNPETGPGPLIPG